MEITKKPKIKSIPYDEFIDNESLEKLVKELNAGGANVALATRRLSAEETVANV